MKKKKVGEILKGSTDTHGRNLEVPMGCLLTGQTTRTSRRCKILIGKGNVLIEDAKNLEMTINVESHKQNHTSHRESTGRRFEDKEKYICSMKTRSSKIGFTN